MGKQDADRKRTPNPTTVTVVSPPTPNKIEDYQSTEGTGTSQIFRDWKGNVGNVKHAVFPTPYVLLFWSTVSTAATVVGCLLKDTTPTSLRGEDHKS